jgi:hypothetical protein
MPLNAGGVPVKVAVHASMVVEGSTLTALGTE